MLEMRSARKEDAPRLAELHEAQVLHHKILVPHLKLLPKIDWGRFVLEKLDRPKPRDIFVADRNGYIVGYVAIRIIDEGKRRQAPRVLNFTRRILGLPSKPSVRLYQPRRFGLVDDIFVEPSLRRLGNAIARRLMERSLTWFEAHGVQEIQGHIWYQNKDSLDFYRKLGAYEVRLAMMADVSALRARYPRV